MGIDLQWFTVLGVAGEARPWVYPLSRPFLWFSLPHILAYIIPTGRRAWIRDCSCNQHTCRQGFQCHVWDELREPSGHDLRFLL